MAEAAASKSYKITMEDGTEDYLQLNSDDLKQWKELADSKESDVKSVTAAEAPAFN
jgi:hypothetical protein